MKLPSLATYVDNIGDQRDATRWRSEHERSAVSLAVRGRRLLVSRDLGDGYSDEVTGRVVRRRGRRILLEFRNGSRAWAYYEGPDGALNLARPLWNMEDAG